MRLVWLTPEIPNGVDRRPARAPTSRPSACPGVLAALGPRPPERPRLPTRDDVAASLDALYRDVGAGSPA